MSACHSSLERDSCISVVETDVFLHALSRTLTLLGSRRVASHQALASASAFWIADCCQILVRNIQNTLILSSVLVRLRYARKARERKFAPSPITFEAVIISVMRNKLITTLPSARKCIDCVQMILWGFSERGEDSCFSEAFSKFL